ncbi:MAG: MBOAT family protein, partial [Terriglobus roseus]|nr:MBOAT family protein [Terriglobus roseus]
MSLSSPVFFVFFLCVIALYWALGGSRRGQQVLLLLANLFFLAKFGPVYLLLPVAALVDFAVGLRLGASTAPAVRKTWVSLSLVVNVGLLVFFKTLPLTGAREWGWLFTLSLSFYCFQSLSYTIDVYRDDAKPERNALTYLASALFFPTILAGPIPRTTKLLRQWGKPFGLTRQQGAAALLLIATGLVKKLLVADYLADNFVNRVFDTTLLYSGVENLLAVYGYALQLFFDFSGYTDIALGVAMLLGFAVPENFRTPYLSVNLQDFWKRWHISFSSWLTDYLFESMPKSRAWLRSSFTYAILTTFLLGGLWHGITWNFLIWGALHGVVLSLVFVWSQSRWKKGRKRRLGEGPLWARILAGLLTFNFVCFTWIFFRAQDLPTAKLVLQQIASLTPGTENLTPTLWAVLGFAALAQAIPQDWFDRAAGWAEAVPFWVQGTAMAGVVL